MRKIKNTYELSKEDLIYTALRTEKNLIENTYLKLLKNKTNTKINEIRTLLIMLDNIINNNEIKKKLYDLEKQTKLSKEQKKYLNNLIIDLEKKVKYKHNDFHDQNYIGIRDIAKLYNNFDNEYYKPMLTSSAFNNNHTEYEIRGDKNKTFTLNQYIIKIKPHIINLINQK